MLLVQDGYSVIQACQWLALPRSSFYYSSVERKDQEIVAAIQDVVSKHTVYGTRRVTHQLHRKPYRLEVNRKRVQRIMRQEGWLRPVKRRKCRTTDSQHPYPRYPNLVKDLQITYPDQVWVADITYIRLRNEFVYLAVILDVFTRNVRGWCLSRQLDQELTLTALKMALLAGTAPNIHHSDQGVQYAAIAYVELLKSHQTQISMAAVGKAEENGYAERFMRTIKEEEVDLSEYQDFSDAQEQIGFFIEAMYNEKRIHSALNYLTPVEFELAWRLALTQPVQEPPPLMGMKTVQLYGSTSSSSIPLLIHWEWHGGIYGEGTGKRVWNSIRWELTIDDLAVDLAAFGPIDVQEAGFRLWNIGIEMPSKGKHILRYEIFPLIRLSKATRRPGKSRSKTWRNFPSYP